MVLTSSDLGDAKIDGADFSDALIDKSQQQKLCQYASGTNSVTGREHAAVAQLRRRRSVRSIQTFFTRPSVSTFDRVGPFQLTDEHFLYGTTLRTSSPSRYMTDETSAKPEAAFDASRFSAYGTGN